MRQARSLKRARLVGREEALRICLCLSVSLLFFAVMARGETPRVLTRAHAHNDYWHERPLVDAMELGFASVEADVFLVDGKLLVGHDPLELKPERTLAALYLEPLRKRVQENGGSVFGEGTPVTLLVDIKSEAGSTYQALAKELMGSAEMLGQAVDGQWQRGAVEVIISGNRPIELVAEDDTRRASIDGRLVELGGDSTVALVPLVSESWQSHFQWDGRGEMPTAERRKLREITELVHRGGRRLRFWATPETEACWRELRAAGVDLIGTDDLEGLADFLNQGGEKLNGSDATTVR